jgi:hypothetical protein
MTIKGRAPGEEDFLSYLRALEASERFSSITITNLWITAQGNIDFSVILSVGG